MIGLYQGKSFFPSKLIRWYSWSKYSHVSWIDGDPLSNEPYTVYEAWHPDGVRKTFDVSVGHEGGTVIDLLDIQLTDIQNARLLEYLESQLGKKYDFLGVFGFLPRWNVHARNRLFCSEYLCNGFIKAGKPLFRPDALPPWKTMPGTVAATPYGVAMGRVVTRKKC